MNRKFVRTLIGSTAFGVVAVFVAGHERPRLPAVPVPKIVATTVNLIPSQQSNPIAAQNAIPAEQTFKIAHQKEAAVGNFTFQVTRAQEAWDSTGRDEFVINSTGTIF